MDSAGSDKVFLCVSMSEVKSAYHHIQGQMNQLGTVNDATLVQEYLVGTEYVIDTVSRDGVHKVVAMWEYDKHAVNDAPFVYFSVRLCNATSAKHKRMMAYVSQCLDALQIRQGPSHAEVMWVRAPENQHASAMISNDATDTREFPCLVEVGARCHGNGGYFLPCVNHCLGYNQVCVTVDSYFDPSAFLALPPVPGSLKAHSVEVSLVSYDHGIVIAMPGLDVIESLASFYCKYMTVQVGSVLRPTVDVFTKPGSVWLLHEREDVVEADIAAIRALERHGLWTVRSLE